MNIVEMTRLERATADILEEVDRLRTDNAYLRKENASLWESVHEGQDAVAELRTMLERAHV